MPNRIPSPFDRQPQERIPTPEEYHAELDSAVSNGLIPKDYADSIRDRYPKWGVEHLKQVKERERLLNEMSGLIPKDYADSIRDRHPEWGVEHLKQVRERERLLNEMSGNEVYGLTEDHLFELRQRDPNYTLRHLEYLKKRELMIAELQKQGLVDENVVASMRKLEDPWYACRQLADIQNREVVEKILPLLRPVEKPIERFSLPAEGESITTHMVESLKKAGLYRAGLKIRVIARERLQKALASGTDRDNTSLVTDHHGGDDGEELAMKENNLDAMRDLEQVTYVSEFDTWNANRKRSGDMVVLVYAPEALKSIQPSQNKTNSFSNGFHMFLDKRLIQPSLLAVFA